MVKKVLPIKNRVKINVSEYSIEDLENGSMLFHKIGSEIYVPYNYREINSYSKKLKDSLESYEKIKREDIVKGIKEEIKIVETYLPSPLSSEEITKIVSETIEEVGKDKKNMGQIMKKIMSKVNGRANGKEIKNLVQKSLEL